VAVLISPIPPGSLAAHAKKPVGKAIESASLFQGRQEVVIAHDGHEYRLRITRQNKLILTK
jgi:hemin uptake protein HemP